MDELTACERHADQASVGACAECSVRCCGLCGQRLKGRLLCPACRIARARRGRPALRIAVCVTALLLAASLLLTRSRSAPGDPGAVASSPPTSTPPPPPTPSRFEFKEGGLSLVPLPGLGKRFYRVGHTRVLEVTRGTRALLTFSSALIYPWGDQRDLVHVPQGWQQGPVRVPELGLTLPFPGKWAVVRSPRLRLYLAADGRLVTISSRNWKEAGIKELLATYRPIPGADSRSIYGRGVRPGPPSARLRQTLAGFVRFLGDDLVRVVPPPVREGVTRFRAGKLDAVDCALLYEELRPLVVRASADRASARTQGCPVGEGGVPRPGPIRR